MDGASEAQLHALLASSRTPEEVSGLLARMLDALPLGVNLFDSTSQMRVLYANPASRRLTAPVAGPIYGRPALEVYPRLAGSPVLGMMEQPLRTGETMEVREFPGSTGQTWNWTAHPLKDAAGRVTSLLVVIEDVSEQVNIRSALREAQDKGLSALVGVSAHVARRVALPEFFTKLTETIAGLVHARRVVFTRWNGADLLEVQEGAYGFTPEQLSIFTVPCRPGHDGLAEQVVFSNGTVRATVRNPPPGLEEYRQLLEVLDAKDVLGVAWHSAGVPLGSLSAFDSGRPEGFTEEDAWLLRLAAVAAALVFQQKQAEERAVALQAEETAKLREHAERMQTLEQAKSRFLNVASHELRGPLSVVQGYLSMINDGSLGPLPTGLRPVLPVMETKIRQMALLVTQMVEATRLEDNRLRLVLSPLDLREVARDAVRSVRALVPSGGHVELLLPGQEVPVNGDSARLETILINLIDNGFKYSPPGSDVTCRLLVEAERAVVRVSDSGIGIAAADLPRLFERFSRIERPDAPTVAGTGLGLYLARELARLHGGEVTVVSEPGSGSEFTVSLPMAPPGA